MATDNISSQLADEVNTHIIDLMRVSASIKPKILELLDALESDLAEQIRKADGKSGVTMARLVALQKQTLATINTAFRSTDKVLEGELPGVLQASAENTSNTINSLLGVHLTSVAFTQGQLENLVRETYINGAFAKEWWGRQGTDLSQRFGMQMRLGLLQGESIDQLVRRIRGTQAQGYTDGIMELSRAQAEALVRTSVVAVGNRGTLESYMQNKDIMKGIQWVSTLDNRTTKICIALDGLMWTLPDNDVNDYGDYVPLGHNKDFPGPTAHWNCRSTQIAILKPFAELIGPKGALSKLEAEQIDTRTRASMDGQVAVAQGFKDWLGKKSEEFQADLLGTAAASLWRVGKLSLRDLTDQHNRPLTAAQLLAKVRARGAITPKIPPLPRVVKPLPPPLVLDETKKITGAGTISSVIARDLRAELAELGMSTDEIEKEIIAMGFKAPPLTAKELRAAIKQPELSETARKALEAQFIALKREEMGLLPIPPKVVAQRRVEAGVKMLKEEFAKLKPSSGLTDELKNADAGTNPSYILDLVDSKGRATGAQGIFKPFKGEKTHGYVSGQLYKREEAAYDVGKMLGLDDLIPVTTTIEVDGEIGSLQLINPDATNAWRWEADPFGVESFDGLTDAKRAAAFDYLISSVDRHRNNWMIDETSGTPKIVLIDNGYSFTADYQMNHSKFLHWAAGKHSSPYGIAPAPITIPDEAREWVKKWPEIQAYLNKNFSPKEVNRVELKIKALANTKYQKFSDLPTFGGDLGLTEGEEGTFQ